MKHALLAVPVILIFFSCTSYHAVYLIDLVNVERTPAAQAFFGDGSITTKDESTSRLIKFDDNLLEATWSMSDYHLNLTMKKKSEAPLAVQWEDSVYIDEKGAHHRIILKGNEPEARDTTQKPSRIRKGSVLNERIIPFDNIKYDKDIRKGWNTLPLFPSSWRNSEKARKTAKACVGNVFSVCLALESSGHVYHYVFTFRISGVKKIHAVKTHF